MSDFAYFETLNDRLDVLLHQIGNTERMLDFMLAGREFPMDVDAERRFDHYWDEFEHESILDSDDEEERFLVPHEAVPVQLFRGGEPEDDDMTVDLRYEHREDLASGLLDSDEEDGYETDVDEWVDPYVTPM